ERAGGWVDGGAHVDAAPLTSAGLIVKSLLPPARTSPALRLGWSRVSPGLPAFVRSMRPAPRASTLARTFWFVFVQTFSFAVVISADLTCAGVQPGCSASSRAAEPATCGA